MRWPRLIGLAAGLAALWAGALIGPDLARLTLPNTLQFHPVEWIVAAALIGRLAAGAWSRRRGVERLDAGADWLLRRGMLPLLAVWTAVRLASWLPHYPFWPWCRDVDNYATFAMHWEAGELPYRDFRAFNFPGHIYLHWALGKLFGWGRTGPFYVVDAAALLALGGALVGWSRRRLAAALPGIFAYFVFLAFYLDLQIEQVAERDWHAGLGMTLALLAIQSLRGRAGIWLSALLAAGAFVIRPQAVLLLPAIGVAMLGRDDADAPSRGWRATAAGIAEWSLAYALFLAAGFAPLAIAGVMGGFVRGLRVVSIGGPYSTFTPARALALLREELERPTTIPLILTLAALGARGSLRWTARAWLAAMPGALLYRPVSPVPHDYLRTPLMLTEAVAWAVPVAWLLRAATSPAAASAGRRAFVGAIALLLLLYESVPTREPYNCSFPASADAIRAAILGGWPDVPPGAWVWFSPVRGAAYPWDDYQRLLEYLRDHVDKDALVANVLKNMPLPPLNGPAGRRSPFRVEAGITWMWMIHEDLDERFARELREAGPNSVVVWVPAETDSQPKLPLKSLAGVIRESYRLETYFGPMEVWRRRPGA